MNMKSVLVKISILALSITASATPGDMTKLVADCHWLSPVQDVGMRVTVTEGGLAGITQLQVSRFFIGRATQVKTYLVYKTPIQRHGLLVFQGDQVKLQINLGVAPNAENRYPAVMETLLEHSRTQEKFACLVK